MKRRWSVLFFAFFIFQAAFTEVPLFAMGRAEMPAVSTAAARTRTVEHITDGDTLILDGGEKVRLIGVDTPEMHDAERNSRTARRVGLSARVVDDYADRARAFLEKTLRGHGVRLEYDWERKDRYGRTLAYAYRDSDGLFVNAEVIKKGYGFAYTRFPFKYLEEFRRLEQDARDSRAGFWGERS